MGNKIPQITTTPGYVFAILGLLLMVLVIVFCNDIDKFTTNLPLSKGLVASGEPVPEEVINNIISDPRNISPESFFGSVSPEKIKEKLKPLFIAQE
ncbi:MAG: hypothetical protein U9M89_00635 [Patescibacteria group bacterium]|nr:hypothetical protein [Patescibacteria group bacterium]